MAFEDYGELKIIPQAKDTNKISGRLGKFKDLKEKFGQQSIWGIAKILNCKNEDTIDPAQISIFGFYNGQIVEKKPEEASDTDMLYLKTGNACLPEDLPFIPILEEYNRTHTLTTEEIKIHEFVVGNKSLGEE